MNQLFDIPLYLLEVNSLSDEDDKGLELLVGNDLSGPPLVQYWPNSTIWASFADAVWNDDNQLQVKMGKFKLGEELLGGRIKIEHTTLMGKPLEYEEVDVKAATFEAQQGRVGRIRQKVHVWETKDVKVLSDLIGREVTFTVRWAKTDADAAREAGQGELGLSGRTGDDAGDPQRELTPEEIEAQVKAALTPANQKIVDELRSDEAAENAAGIDADALYAVAKNHVITERNASVSWLQRTMKLGYNKASELIERMQAEGIVGEPQPGGSRDVLSPKTDDQIPLSESRRETDPAAGEAGASSDETKPPVASDSIDGRKPPQRRKSEREKAGNATH